MSLVLEDEDFSISRSGNEGEAVLVRRKLNAIHARLRLILVDTTPLRLGYFLPHFDESVVATGGH